MNALHDPSLCKDQRSHESVLCNGQRSHESRTRPPKDLDSRDKIPKCVLWLLRTAEQCLRACAGTLY
eukprot:365145-Chlamydomonas_euryale.AAC.18